MTVGLYIGRLNPPHLGHINTIEKALFENKKVLVLLGTPIFSDGSNPLDFKQRKELLETKFGNKIIVQEIVDTKSDLLWAYNIYKLLYQNSFGIRSVNFYGGDFENDSAYLVIKEYEDKILGFNFNYIENTRKNSFVEYKGKKYKMSATNLRKILENKHYDLAKRFCDKEMFDNIKNKFNS